ncbi:MAG TPA: hypothetical protein VKD72_29515 [Gemmataceae bacterium]|nr:hypothetical protein [Gemmataceae bacterium]
MRRPSGERLAAVLLLLPVLAPPVRAADKDPGPLLARIKAVRGKGEGNAEARRAWQELVRLGPDALLPTLAAMDSADTIASNWLRSATDAIAEKAFAARSLSATDLEAFVLKRKHSGAARRIAYEWLVRLDPKAPARLLPGMLDEPGAELRRDAVTVVLDEAKALAEKGDKEKAIAAYRRAFDAARDEDQVEATAKSLKDLGVTVDLTAHYGAIRRWLLVSPFDNTGEKGYQTVYPPEKGVDPSATYKGKEGAEVRWVAHTTNDPRGVVDLNEAISKRKHTVTYAWTVIESPREQPVQIRAGCNTAIKIFLNGRLVFAREEYHHGLSMDQHIGRGTLKAGRNEVLVKVCQNNQNEPWAQDWKVMVRLCDDIGGAVPFKVVLGNGAPREKGKGGR